MGMNSAERERPDAENRQFKDEWSKLRLVYCLLQTISLEKLLRTVDVAESVGPVLYPSEYRAGMRSLQDQRRVLVAAIRLRETLEALEALGALDDAEAGRE